MDLPDIDCVVPAAGLSSRMPGHKLLTPFRGRPLVQWALENAAAACKRVIVVVGHNEPGIREVLPRSEGLVIVTNEHYPLGMLTSIAVGASVVETDRFFVAPADMPFLSQKIYEAVATASSTGQEAGDRSRDGTDAGGRTGTGAPPESPVAWFPAYRGRRGHPVLISASVIPALVRTVDAAVSAGSRPGSMRELLARYATVSVPVTDDGTLVDIDTMDDLDRYSGNSAEQ